jgi:hypothetical protein
MTQTFKQWTVSEKTLQSIHLKGSGEGARKGKACILGMGHCVIRTQRRSAFCRLGPGLLSGNKVIKDVKDLGLLPTTLEQEEARVTGTDEGDQPSKMAGNFIYCFPYLYLSCTSIVYLVDCYCLFSNVLS